MDERALIALKGSIRKWEAIVAGDGEDDGPKNCPLCQLFHEDFGGNGNLITCGGCPVREATGKSGCEGTPYDKYEFADDEQENEAARQELDFLRSLLPEEAS